MSTVNKKDFLCVIIGNFSVEEVVVVIRARHACEEKHASGRRVSNFAYFTPKSGRKGSKNMCFTPKSGAKWLKYSPVTRAC